MANPTRVKTLVEQVRSLGQGVYEVRLGVDSRATRFLPGQFLHLTLDDFDPTLGYWPESRVFSIASPPRQDFLTIVYSVKGSYTSRMAAELVPGREVWVKLPFGSFVISDESLSPGPLVLLAGGTGVSPYIPFLVSSQTLAREVHLYYGVRLPEHFLFEREISDAVAAARIKANIFVEVGQLPQLPFRQGRLSISAVKSDLGSEHLSAHYYISGPPTMIAGFRSDLAKLGIGTTNIHIDEWE